jgi:hypothetical protein
VDETSYRVVTATTGSSPGRVVISSSPIRGRTNCWRGLGMSSSEALVATTFSWGSPGTTSSLEGKGVRPPAIEGMEASVTTAASN